MSSWWSEKLAWGTGQVGIRQNRLGDCSLESQILQTAFPELPLPHTLALPSRRRVPMSTSLSGCPGHTPLWHSPDVPTQPPGLSIKVTPPGTPPPGEGWGLLHSSEHNSITWVILWTALFITQGTRMTSDLTTGHHYLTQPQLMQRIKMGKRGSCFPLFNPCLLSLLPFLCRLPLP